ncbi:hypothetical protein HY492_01655 [Candidatus Woesearchaeota archaeon]|nr:hypothetical protein [Candidatus Woesearchaeota archaeon]
MGFKTMTVADDAYALAGRAKLPGESFSALLRRTYGRKLLVRDLVGAVKMTGKEFAETKARMADWRKNLDESMERRVARVRARFRRNN